MLNSFIERTSAYDVASFSFERTKKLAPSPKTAPSVLESNNSEAFTTSGLI